MAEPRQAQDRSENRGADTPRGFTEGRPAGQQADRATGDRPGEACDLDVGGGPAMSADAGTGADIGLNRGPDWTDSEAASFDQPGSRTPGDLDGQGGINASGGPGGQATARDLVREAKEQAGDAATRVREQARGAAEQVKEQAVRAGEQIRASASQLFNDARDRGARSLAQQKEALTNQIGGFSHAMYRAADTLHEEGDHAVAGYVESLGSGVERVAQYLNERDLTRLADDARECARRRPGLFYGGFLLAGLALARFIKSSAGHTGASPSSAGEQADWQDSLPSPQAATPTIEFQDTGPGVTGGGSGWSQGSGATRGTGGTTGTTGTTGINPLASGNPDVDPSYGCDTARFNNP